MGKLPPPPPAARGDDAEVLHGDRIADPYRWLERDSAPTRAWTEAENARTRVALDAAPARGYFSDRLPSLLGIGPLGTPRPYGDRVFYERRSSGERQAVLRVREHGQ